VFANLARTAFATLALFTTTLATAQTAPPSNVDDRFRAQVQPVTEADRQNALLTGDTDIILLRKTKLFTLSGGITGNYSSNAALSPDTPKADASLQAQVGLRIGTRIGGRVDVFADIGVVGVRYAKYVALDYSALNAAVGAQMTVKGFDLAAVYQPSMIFDRSFSKRQLTQHRFRVSLSRRFKLGPLYVDPSLSAERVIAHPGDYSNWAGGGDVSVTLPLSKRRPISLYATGGYERRAYDSYFPDLVGVKRKDDHWNGGIGLSYSLGRWGGVNLGYSYGQNFSTSDVNVYHAHSGALSISARVRF
jgi:hypothetical protein